MLAGGGLIMTTMAVARPAWCWRNPAPGFRQGWPEAVVTSVTCLPPGMSWP
jgi:hypothetical protein